MLYVSNGRRLWDFRLPRQTTAKRIACRRLGPAPVPRVLCRLFFLFEVLLGLEMKLKTRPLEETKPFAGTSVVGPIVFSWGVGFIMWVWRTQSSNFLEVYRRNSPFAKKWSNASAKCATFEARLNSRSSGRGCFLLYDFSLSCFGGLTGGNDIATLLLTTWLSYFCSKYLKVISDSDGDTPQPKKKRRGMVIDSDSDWDGEDWLICVF